MSARHAPLHPVVHLAPPTGWLNDPNGLCFHNGRWHAFYQHDPYGDLPTAMHWGHASSDDLIHWNHLPVALQPDDLGQAFSGSVVTDTAGSAGFGPGAMVAVFTHHLDQGGRISERQSLAFSIDDGITWTKHPGNPVLDTSSTDARDPYVIQLVDPDGTPYWSMALAAGRHIEFYRSIDLRSWERSGTYSIHVPGGVWECPSWSRLTLPSGRNVWLLTFSVAEGGPYGAGATLGIFGDFDGATFVAEQGPVLLDYGPDFYAAQTFATCPGDPVMMAWLGSWANARNNPSFGRRGQLTIARRLGAHEAEDDRIVVHAEPVLANLVATGSTIDANRWTSDSRSALLIDCQNQTRLTIRSATGDEVAVCDIDDVVELVRRDLDSDVEQTFRAECAAGGRHRILLDHGSIEIFADDGRSTMSASLFAGEKWHVNFEGDVRATRLRLRASHPPRAHQPDAANHG